MTTRKKYTKEWRWCMNQRIDAKHQFGDKRLADEITVGHAQSSHAVKHITSNAKLGGLRVDFACSQMVIEDSLEAIHADQIAKRQKRMYSNLIPIWQQNRNAVTKRINWHFTIADSRIKLRCLYPTLV